MHHISTPLVSKALSNRGQHSISYTLSRSHSVIVEYTHDSDTDMFQIGRSTENMIDFVVTDTSPGGGAAEGPSAQSTISRYACRILCDRRPPYTARIYAAGFDASSNIFLGERAAKWRTPDGLMDGLTTNGVLVMHPAGGFSEDSAPGVWREISVCGNVYTLRDSRSAQQRGKLVENESNVLQDGSLIDLCGATLLWRTPAGLLRAPTLKQLEAQRQEANAARPQCPVGLSTLAFPSPARGRTAPDKQQPWVYVRCGHVHGYHGWGCRRERGPQERECPLCRLVGPYVPLWLGQEAGLCLDPGPPSHAFAPCGHVCSEKTARYWAQTPLPHGTHAFHAACPFCGAWLTAPCLRRDLPKLVSEAGNHNLLATCTPGRYSGPSARLGCSEQELKASEKVQGVSPEEGQSWEGSSGEGSCISGQGKCLVTNERGVQGGRKEGWGFGYLD
ncbi:E3 ubiquitin-protein ligase pellino homolog 3 isoform X5 [Callospermophilus lateralis]